MARLRCSVSRNQRNHCSESFTSPFFNSIDPLRSFDNLFCCSAQQGFSRQRRGEVDPVLRRDTSVGDASSSRCSAALRRGLMVTRPGKARSGIGALAHSGVSFAIASRITDRAARCRQACTRCFRRLRPALRIAISSYRRRLSASCSAPAFCCSTKSIRASASSAWRRFSLK